MNMTIENVLMIIAGIVIIIEIILDLTVRRNQ
jgi:hypothetical protein